MFGSIVVHSFPTCRVIVPSASHEFHPSTGTTHGRPRGRRMLDAPDPEIVEFRVSSFSSLSLESGYEDRVQIHI